MRLSLRLLRLVAKHRFLSTHREPISLLAGGNTCADDKQSNLITHTLATCTMATRRLVTLPRRTPAATRSASTEIEALQLKSKLNFLENPNPSPTTRVTTLPNDIRVALRHMMAQPEYAINELLHLTAFEHTPLCLTIRGDPDNIMIIKKKDIQDYLSTHYTPHRMVIAASGAVEHGDIVEQVKKMFTKLSTNPVTSAQLVEKKPAIFTGSEIRIGNDWEQEPFAQFGIAFKGASWTDPDSIALMVIQAMLGSWNKASDVDTDTSSLLARTVGIDDHVQIMKAKLWHYKDTGLFGIYASAKPECLHDLASAIMKEMSKLCYQVAEEDLIRAKNQLKSSISEEEPNAVEIGQQLLACGRVIPSAELLGRIDAVDVATVKRIANKYIFGQDIAIAAAGKVKQLPDYNWFRSRNSVLRY